MATKRAVPGRRQDDTRLLREFFRALADRVVLVGDEIVLDPDADPKKGSQVRGFVRRPTTGRRRAQR